MVHRAISDLRMHIFEFQNASKLFADRIVKVIQTRWRCKQFLNKLRLRILQRLWDSRIHKLVASYKQSSKASQSALKKLKAITASQKNAALKSYYANAAAKHQKQIAEWLDKRQVI